MVENGKTVYYIFLRGDNMGGLEELMKDLGVSTFEELKEYIESPKHKDEEIVNYFYKECGNNENFKNYDLSLFNGF